MPVKYNEAKGKWCVYDTKEDAVAAERAMFVSEYKENLWMSKLKESLRN